MIWLPTFDDEDPAVIGVRTSRVDDGPPGGPMSHSKNPAPAPELAVHTMTYCGLRDLLSAARAVLAHSEPAGGPYTMVLRDDVDALRGQVNEATEAGL